VRRVHRRHRCTLREGGPRDLPRRRDDRAELAAIGVGAIIVPLPGAIADEQSANAQFLVDAGAAVKIAQSNLTPELLAERIQSFTRDSLLAMALAAKKVARPDAAARVADACIALWTPTR